MRKVGVEDEVRGSCRGLPTVKQLPRRRGIITIAFTLSLFIDTHFSEGDMNACANDEDEEFTRDATYSLIETSASPQKLKLRLVLHCRLQSSLVNCSIRLVHLHLHLASPL